MGQLTDDDKLLFRQALGLSSQATGTKNGNRTSRADNKAATLQKDGTTLIKHGRVIHQKPKPEPRARFREADERQVLEELLDIPEDWTELDSGHELNYHQPGIQARMLKDLRRGRFAVQATLDLHGLTVTLAKTDLDRFLANALDQDYRCVKIIHGKGNRSGNRGPVLKAKLNVWLRRRADVLAFGSARPVDGGTGAALVLLRRQ